MSVAPFHLEAMAGQTLSSLLALCLSPRFCLISQARARVLTILGERLLRMVPKICVSHFYVTIPNHLTEFGWLRGKAREKGCHWQLTVAASPACIPRIPCLANLFLKYM